MALIAHAHLARTCHLYECESVVVVASAGIPAWLRLYVHKQTVDDNEQQTRHICLKVVVAIEASLRPDAHSTELNKQQSS